MLLAFAHEAYMTGAMEQAATALYEVLVIRRESGDSRGVGESLCLMARVLGALGRYSEAARAGHELNQNERGSPKICSDTYDRMRFVEMGAT